MRTELLLQDPTAGGGTVLDQISQAARDADSGGGIFAFASTTGIEMLFEDKFVGRVARSRGFELVVGVDAITDTKALTALTKRAKSHKKLNVRVLLHETPALMHPKLCWFVHGDTLKLLVGSGNLTRGGLMSNFEGLLSTELRHTEARGAMAEIDGLLARWRGRLLSPSSRAAMLSAKENTGSERSLLRKMTPASEAPPKSPAVRASAEVLVAEISKNVDRRTQLDVGIDVFTGFFGAKPQGGHILIQPVDPKGDPEDVETPRAIFPTKSHNYRFEARAGAGRPYPPKGSGRPFGVFVRMPDGIYRYFLLWPGEPGYAEVDALLGTLVGPVPKTRPMRRITVDLSALEAAWPTSPLLKSLTVET